MSFQSRLDEFAARFGLRDDQPAFTTAIQRFVADEERRRPLKTGDIAPTFALRDHKGQLVSSAELLSQGPLVLTFYRGLWCPYCQRDIQGFREALSQIRASGASVVAISRRSPSVASEDSNDDVDIGFTLLEDETGKTAEQFRIRWGADDFARIQRELGLGLPSFSGTAPWIVPMQARFVLDQSGTVVFDEVAFDYNERSEPTEVMPVLGQLKEEC